MKHTPKDGHCHQGRHERPKTFHCRQRPRARVGIRRPDPRSARDSQEDLRRQHRETATGKNELGLLLWERGDVAGAEPLFRENVATSQRVLGADHPNVGAAKASLAQVLMAKGDAAGAEALLRESLAVRGRVFGDARPEYAITLNNLANAVEAQGRLDEHRVVGPAPQRVVVRTTTSQPRTRGLRVERFSDVRLVMLKGK